MEVKVTAVKPVPPAATVLAPTLAPSVSTVWARPAASVGTAVWATVPPPTATVKVAMKPDTVLPYRSTTATTRGFWSPSPAIPVWLSPDTIEIWDASPAVAVAVKLTRDHLRFWYVFEPLGKNEHGYPEYKHRQTGIAFVRVPGGKFRMGMGDPNEESQVEDLFRSSRIPRGVPMRPIGMLRTERPAHEVALSSYLIAKYGAPGKAWERGKSCRAT